MLGKFIHFSLILFIIGVVTAAKDFTPQKHTQPQLDIDTRDSVTNQVTITDAEGTPIRKREGDKQPFMWHTTVKLDDGVATVSYNVTAQGNRVITTPSDTSKITVLATARGDTLTAGISVKLLGDTALQINSTDVNDNRWVGVMVIGR